MFQRDFLNLNRSSGTDDESWLDLKSPPPLFRLPDHWVDQFPFTDISKSLTREAPLGKYKTPSEPATVHIDTRFGTYQSNLDERTAIHLLRRSGFGGSPSELQDLVGADIESTVDDIVDEAVARPLPEPPVWANETLPRRTDQEEFERYLRELNPEWLTEYYCSTMEQFYSGGLRERLTLFWHDHFVTQIGDYVLAPFAYRYMTTLREYALGNFKEFVHAIGLDPAMLIYLNGDESRVGAPNENYARELLELFTMGQFNRLGLENYTQSDIEQIARALTGWLVDPFRLAVDFVPAFHDFGDKTIFGQTGTWDYDDVIDLLFEERGQQIAEFIVAKLYREFVYASVDDDAITELAQLMIDSDFEIAPVVRAILKSTHFFDEQVIAARIKSPVELLLALMRESDTTPVASQFSLLYFGAFILDQRVLDPPNVAGWPGHHAWLNTTTLPTRWLAANALIFGDEMDFPAMELVSLAEDLLAAEEDAPDPNDPASVFVLARAMAENFLAVPLDTLDVSPTDDGWAGDLTSQPIPDEYRSGPDHVLALAQAFLLDIIPWYDWRIARREAPVVLRLYLMFLANLPEFQLA